MKLTIPIIAIILIVGLSGTAVASQNTLPNDALYPVKIAMEKIELLLSSMEGQDSRAETKLRHALRRLEEVQALIEEHQESGVTEEEENEEEEAIEDLEEEVEEAVEETEEAVGGEEGERINTRSIERKEELIQKMERLTERHREVLERVHDKVPEHAKQSIERVMEKAGKGHQKAIENFQRFIERKQQQTGDNGDDIECETSITCEEGYIASDSGEIDEYECPIFECIPETQ